MNKKNVLLAGLIGTTSVAVLGAAFSFDNTNSLRASSVSTESGAHVDRSVTITDFVRRGFYVKSTSHVDGYFNSYVSYELDNPGSYGFVELFANDYNDIVNIEDGLFNFTSASSVSNRLMYFTFEANEHFYDSKADADADKNELPIYNFTKGLITSIVIEMGDRNVGEIKTENDGCDIGYNSSTKTYTLYNIKSNVSGLYIRATEENKLFHIKSMTFNYNC